MSDYLIKNMAEYEAAYQKSVDAPEEFWAEIAETFTWQTPWDKVLDWNFSDPRVEWFSGGMLNITENCLDRHLPKRGEQVAIFWEPNEDNADGVKMTYRELHTAVCQAANYFTELGIKKGDRVCLYMPMVPELLIACLGCARIGAIHSVVFGGFSATALADRIVDAQAKVLITADGVYRGSKWLALKEICDEAIANAPCVECCVVVSRHSEMPCRMVEGRDVWWHEGVPRQAKEHQAVAVEAEHPLFILYTSGSTGKPKGVVHTTGGYMVYTEYAFRNVFQVGEGDIYWCTADIGWITGHSYIAYAPLLAGTTQVLFEGVPTFPDAGRFWKVVDKYQVTHFYTAPTAIRALEAQGLAFVEPYRLDSLKVLGSVGEPINTEAWEWYHTNIGKGRCAIVDTYWQTETGGFLISPLAGITKEKAGFATLPLPGIQLEIVDHEGTVLEANGVEGNLCIKFPWPSILRTTYGDHERCRTTYFSTYSNKYFTGDGCRRDEDGYYRITGRVDDVINVSGHRMGTAEVEDALNKHSVVVESAVVGFSHGIKGQGIFAYVICKEAVEDEAQLSVELKKLVSDLIGPIARPEEILFVRGLPKTRSGKIMRRILRKVAERDVSSLGDTSTLVDPSIVDHLIEKAAL